MTDFTPLSALAGGAIIGLAAVLLMIANGRIAGISGIVGRLLPPVPQGEAAWRIAFLAGLLGSPMLVNSLSSTPIEISVSPSIALMTTAGCSSALVPRSAMVAPAVMAYAGWPGFHAAPLRRR